MLSDATTRAWRATSGPSVWAASRSNGTALAQPTPTTFADYLLPLATDSPNVELMHTETPSPLNPLGLKGAGEGGANPVGAAIAAAIDDALGRPGAVTQLPVTPQRLRALLRNVR